MVSDHLHLTVYLNHSVKECRVTMLLPGLTSGEIATCKGRC